MSGTDATESPPLPLSEKHLSELRASTLTDDTIRAAGLYTITDGKVATRLMNRKKPIGPHGPFLAFPFKDAEGKPADYVRLKPDNPRIEGKDGKEKIIKYESPVGSGNRVYIPPNTRAFLADPSVRLIVTEGEKKALALDQAGFPCLGLVGVYGWQKKRDEKDGKKSGPRLLVDDLAAVAWRGREVVIMYDSDAVRNELVRWAEFHLSETLSVNGAKVTVGRIPEGGRE